MSLAVATVEGIVGNDPQKFKAGEVKAVSFSVATNKKIKGEMRTSWHQCVSFGKGAEWIAENFKKGTAVIVSGELTVNEYEKDGVKHRPHQIAVNSFSYAGRKVESPAQQTQGGNW